MQRISGAGHVDNLFVEEDINAGQQPTTITASWMNALQEEIANVVEYGGGSLNSASNTQLIDKILALIEDKSTFINEIKIWGGAISAIPSGWHLCDGTNGTRDLRHRFIKGAAIDWFEGNAGGFVGETGGSPDAIVPLHDHPTTVTLNQTPHSHAISNQSNSDAGSGKVAVGSTAVEGANPSTDTTSISLTVGVEVGEVGEPAENANLPPFYTLAYIQRIS